MKETLQQLRRHHQPVPVPLELPDEDRLVEVEEELLMAIPADLRQYLLRASDIVFGSLEPVTAADPVAHTYLPDVAAQAWDFGLPRHLLPRSEEHTSELQSRGHLVCRLLLEKKKTQDRADE